MTILEFHLLRTRDLSAKGQSQASAMMLRRTQSFCIKNIVAEHLAMASIIKGPLAEPPAFSSQQRFPPPPFAINATVSADRSVVDVPVFSHATGPTKPRQSKEVPSTATNEDSSISHGRDDPGCR